MADISQTAFSIVYFLNENYGILIEIFVPKCQPKE